MHVTCPGRALEVPTGHSAQASRTVSLVSRAVPGAHALHDPTTAIDSSVVDPVMSRYLPPAQMTLQLVRAVSYMLPAGHALFDFNPRTWESRPTTRIAFDGSSPTPLLPSPTLSTFSGVATDIARNASHVRTHKTGRPAMPRVPGSMRATCGTQKCTLSC